MRKNNVALLMVTFLALTVSAQAGDLFSKMSWRMIKDEPKPKPSGALLIPEVRNPPVGLKEKIAKIREKGVKLDFVTYPNGQKPKMASSAHLCFDPKNLYVLITGEQSKDCRLKENHHEKETSHIWQDDNFELFVDPFLSRNEYMHFIINPLGEFYDAQCFIKMIPDPKAADQSELMPALETNMGYSAQADVQALKGSGEWSVCVAIPFSTLGIETAPLGQPWGFNFCHTNREIDELSQWKVTNGPLGFHTPEQFGVLVFGDKQPAVRTEFVWEIPGYGANLIKLNTDNPGAPTKGMVKVMLVRPDEAGETLLTREESISKGASTIELPFKIPFSERGKRKITVQLAVDGETTGYFIKNLTLDGPMKLVVPLTQIYTSDKVVKGTVRLFLGEAELKTATLKFKVMEGDRVARSADIKPLSGNFLSFAVNIQGLKVGAKTLVASLCDAEGKTVADSKLKFDILEAPFPF